MEARPYTAATLFAVLSTGALVTALDRASTRSWIRYGLASLCMILLQLIAVLVVASQLVGVAAARRRFAWRYMFITLGFLAVAISPLVVVAAGETEQVSWIAPTSIRTFGHALLALSGGPVEGAALVICGVMLTLIIASSPPSSEKAFGATLCLAWGAGPPLLLIFVSFLHPLYVDRYALVCVPGIALIEAMAAWHAWTIVTARRQSRASSPSETPVLSPFAPAGHQTAHPRGIFPVAVITCVAACLAGPAMLINTGQVLMQRYYVDDYRSAATALSNDLSERPAPVAIIPDWSGVGFSYYLTPPTLANTLSAQEAEAINHHTLNWQPITFGSGTVEWSRHMSILNWPTGGVPEVRKDRCGVGWAIGRGVPPAGSFNINGRSCRLSHIHYYGAVWVAAAGGSG
jgi:hypothetical protein